MPHIKALFHFFDSLFYTFWGITIINTVSIVQDGMIKFEEVEGTVFQYIYMMVGFAYGAVMAWNKLADGKQKREDKKIEMERKKLENLKIKEEIEMIEWQNDEKKSH